MKNTSTKKKPTKKTDRWPLTAFFLTLCLSLVFSAFSETVLFGVPLAAALAVLALIVCIGIAADTIGVAVTVQDVTVYTAMASKKIRGAKQAIRLVQNSTRVSNICNDVIGDICGIVSGAMGAAIASQLIFSSEKTGDLIVSIAVSSLIAAFTVGGKALGKRYAIRNSREIVFAVAKVLALFETAKGK